MCAKLLLSCPTLCDPLWTVACQAPLSMGFFMQEYWSGLPFPPPGGLPDPGMEPVSPVSPALQVRSLLAEPLVSPTRTSNGSILVLSYSMDDDWSPVYFRGSLFGM